MATLLNVAGLDKLARQLRSLPDKVSKKHLKFAVMRAARLVRDEARNLAPVDTGRLKKSIIIKFQAKRSSKQQATYYVLAKRGKKYQRIQRTRTRVVAGRKTKVTVIEDQDAYYWRYVEFGTARTRAKKFMRPAFERKKKECVDLIAELLRKGIHDSLRDN